MVAIVEFTLLADAFPFGRATSSDPTVRVQLERVVPIDEDHIPFVWAASEAGDSRPKVGECEAVLVLSAVLLLSVYLVLLPNLIKQLAILVARN